MKIKKIGFEISIIIILSIMYLKFIPVWFKEWSNFDSFYAFGFFMLAFQVYFFKTNWNAIKLIPKNPSYTGILFLIPGFILYTVGIKAGYDYLTNLALPFFLIGIILSCYGIKLLKFSFIPLILFTFALPILPLHRLTMPLQLASASITSHIMNFLGIVSHNEGSTLFVEKYRIAVAPGCSGLKSLSTLFFICLIYAYFIRTTFFKKSLFVLASFPIAISINVLRILFVGFYALYNGYNGLVEFHDNAGLVGYVLSIAIIVPLAQFIESKPEEKIEKQGALNLEEPSGEKEYSKFKLVPLKHKIIVLIFLLSSLVIANLHFNNHKNKLILINQAFPYKISNWEGKDIKSAKSIYEMIDKEEFLFREYHNTANNQKVILAIVLTNKRDHIHDPEVCYRGQGISMENEKPLKIDPAFVANYVYGATVKENYNMLYWYTDLENSYSNRAIFMKDIAKILFFDKPSNGFGLVVLLGTEKETKRKDLSLLAEDINNYLKTLKDK